MRIVCLAVIGVLALSSCRISTSKRVKGNGVRASVERQVSGFTGIEVLGAYNVTITQGAQFRVQVEGDNNLLAYIETARKGQVLQVTSRKGFNLRPRTPIRISVTAPRLNLLRISGSGDIISQSALKSPEELRVLVKGSGSVVLRDVDAPVIKTNLDGSGTIELKGKTRTFYADLSGSGDIHAGELRSEAADVEVEGSGTTAVFASRQLKTNIEGSGEVLYKGDPSLTQRKAGSGGVRKID